MCIDCSSFAKKRTCTHKTTSFPKHGSPPPSPRFVKHKKHHDHYQQQQQQHLFSGTKECKMKRIEANNGLVIVIAIHYKSPTSFHNGPGTWLPRSILAKKDLRMKPSIDAANPLLPYIPLFHFLFVSSSRRCRRWDVPQQHHPMSWRASVLHLGLVPHH